MVEKEALLFEDLNGRIRCCTCERRCELLPDTLGFCQTRENVSGKLYTLVYGEISSISANPIEKKPPGTVHTCVLPTGGGQLHGFSVCASLGATWRREDSAMLHLGIDLHKYQITIVMLNDAAGRVPILRPEWAAHE